MSFALEFRGQNSAIWLLSDQCVEHIEHLRRTDVRWAIEAVFGSEETSAGTVRTVDRNVLVAAVEALIPRSKALRGGYQVRVPPLFPGTQPITGRAVGGVVIDGKDHVIECFQDYWTIQATEEKRAGKEGVRRYEPDDIATDNLGKVKVEARRSKVSDFSTLLPELQIFLGLEEGGSVQVMWG